MPETACAAFNISAAVCVRMYVTVGQLEAYHCFIDFLRSLANTVPSDRSRFDRGTSTRRSSEPFSWQHFAPRLPSGSVIEIRSDSTTAVAYVMSQGGRWPHLNRVAQMIWSLAIRNRWHLQASYIQGSNNSIADYLLRLGSDRYD